MYEIVKTRGPFAEALAGVAQYEDEDQAWAAAREYLQMHADEFRRGLEGASVRHLHPFPPDFSL